MIAAASVLAAAVGISIAMSAKVGMLAVTAGGLMVLTIRKPVVAMYLVAVALPLESPVFQVPLKTVVVSDLTIALAVLAWVVSAKPLTRFHWRIGLPVAVYVAVAAMSVIFALDRSTSFQQALSLVKSALLFYLATSLLRSSAARWGLIAAIGVGATVSTIYAAVQLAQPELLTSYQFAPDATWNVFTIDLGGQIFPRARAWFGDPNTFGIYQGAALAMCGFAAAYRPPRLRVVFLLLALGAGIGAFLSLSRSPVVAVVGATLLLVPAVAKSRRQQLIAPVVIALAIAGAVLGLADASTPFAARVLSIPDLAYVPNALRLDIWAVAVQQWLAHPILGVGYAGFEGAAAGGIPGFDRSQLIGPHNVFLEVLTGTGTVGFVAFAWMLVRAFRIFRSAASGARLRERLTAAGQLAPFVVGVLTLLIAGLFQAELHSYAMNGLLFISLGGLSAGAADLSLSQVRSASVEHSSPIPALA